VTCIFLPYQSFGSLAVNVWGSGRRITAPSMRSDWSPSYVDAADATCVLCMYAQLQNNGAQSDYAEVEFRITRAGGSPVTSYVLNLPAGTDNRADQVFVVSSVDKLLTGEDIIELWINQIYPATFIDAFATLLHFTPP
jgi:hypothetical protein